MPRLDMKIVGEDEFLGVISRELSLLFDKHTCLEFPYSCFSKNNKNGWFDFRYNRAGMYVEVHVAKFQCTWFWRYSPHAEPEISQMNREVLLKYHDGLVRQEIKDGIIWPINAFLTKTKKLSTMNDLREIQRHTASVLDYIECERPLKG